MDDKYKKLLQEEKRAFDAMREEPHFEVSSFTEELLPLLGDYFVGSFVLKDNAIICTFANGQVIRLSATEVQNEEGNGAE